MSTQDTTAGTSPAHDLFVLSDEQILEIAPDGPESAAAGQPFWGVQERASESAERTPTNAPQPVTSHEPRVTGHDPAAAKSAQPREGEQAQMAVPLEPPAWLAAQMQDAWAGEEAREFWGGVQQARSEAAAYRAAIASPEDARALKELYPGGVSEARAAAERARLLDDVDRAYFGAAGNSREQTSASRAQLAQRMLREDPAAFREMVETGIKILQEAAGSQSHGTKSLASVVSPSEREKSDKAAPVQSSATGAGTTVGAQHAAPLLGNSPAAEAQVAAYAAFERAANEDLERSVGSAIERTLAQALPSFEQHSAPRQGEAQHSFGSAQDRAAPLREHLTASVRADVEKALQGDRQLGEQVAQILAARRFDNDSRAHIVRLISERAQQLIPGAAKRVLNEWTQTALAAHRGRTQRDDSASAKVEVVPASTPMRAIANSKTQTRSQNINYRKLSDEQILEM